MAYLSIYDDFTLETNNFDKGNKITVHVHSDGEDKFLQGKILDSVYRENCMNEDDYDGKCEIAESKSDYAGEFVTDEHIVYVAITV